ncbi:MAG: YgiT-type zinc finger protein [Deltaproteobacteria bacterium]|nr:YgiT-type zinc finger protein [Deltaproteobacteria bacterium]
MKCQECRGEMTSRREAHRYVESGLPNVTLVDVEVRQCPRCGERTVGIPRVEELHRLLALELARKPERLLPNEIRFLRKYLGLSGVDFAERMRVDPATVSRWEREQEPQPMGPQAELLLRLMAVRDRPVSDYTEESMEGAARADAAPLSVRLRPSRGGWRHDDADRDAA